MEEAGRWYIILRECGSRVESYQFAREWLEVSGDSFEIKG